MNFQDLLTKIRTIDESDNAPTSPTDSMLTGSQDIGGDPTDKFISDVEVKDVQTDECGGMMQQSSPMKQQDNVTMNVSMNGSGAGGIRDLMGILKNIEQADSDKGNVVFGTEEFANEPNEQVAPISAVTPTGNDMHSKGGEAPKVNGGGNPMHEALASRLYQMYQDIKEAKSDKFDALKHVKNPTKGEKEAAKDVKRGSYADRAAMLKSAEADGRLKEGEKKTMSRAAKGHEKYGKEGMAALAKAGKEGASEKELDNIRDKHDKYDEAINESANIIKLSKMLNG